MCAAIDLSADRERWAGLAERALVPNPYAHPDFVVPAAEAFGDGSISLLVAGDWDAALPVQAAKRWRGLPVRGSLDWMHDQCFLGTPLLASADGFGALLEELPASGLFGEIDISWLPAELPRGTIRFGEYSRPAVERRAENTYTEGRLSGKHRRANRRLGRDMAAELGGELALVDRAGDPAAVDTFLALEDAGWKGEGGTSLRRVPGGEAFLHAMCRDFAARGALQLLFLEAGGHVAAARLNLRAGAEIFCFKIAFDEALKRYSPGLQMELHMLDHFHADETAARMDSCADPGSEMFNRIWPDRKPLGGVLVPRTRAIAPALRAVANRISARRAQVTPAADV